MQRLFHEKKKQKNLNIEKRSISQQKQKFINIITVTKSIQTKQLF